MALWDYLENGGKRAVEVAHRRWGKDDIALHFTAIAAQERVGNYWHMLPQFNQCRKAIWEAINPRTGKKRIDDAFPEEMRSSTRTTDMFIGFKNGSSWQLVGFDNYNALVGSVRAAHREVRGYSTAGVRSPCATQLVPDSRPK